jgi:hypothetical protein
MKIPWRFLTVVLAAVAGLLLLAACGGGGSEEKVSLEEYFQQFDAIEEGMKTSTTALDEQSQGVVGEDVQATRDYIDGYYDIVSQGLNDVKALQPPSEAKDAQDEFVAALSDMIALWKDLGDRLANVETSADLQEVLAGVADDTSWQDASQKFTDACRNLQGIATDNGIDVTLDCE